MMKEYKPSKLSLVLDAVLYHIRVLPALPVSAWWGVWFACVAMLLASIVVQLVTGQWWRTLNGLSGFGFCLLAFTPTLRVSYHIRIPALYGEMWIPIDKRFLAEAIADVRVTHLERLEWRDARIKRVEPLPLPNRETRSSATRLP